VSWHHRGYAFFNSSENLLESVRALFFAYRQAGVGLVLLRRAILGDEALRERVPHRRFI